MLLLCVFPASLFLGAPYSESLFLAASIGAFYAARTGHWAAAGAAAAAASATRSAGVLLLLPLAILYWQGTEPGRRLRPHLAWLALAPAGLVAYARVLALAHGDPLAFSSAQELWSREFAGPFVGVWDGAVAAFDGVRQLGSGSRETVYFEHGGRRPVPRGRHQPDAVRLAGLRRRGRAGRAAPAAVRLRRVRGRGPGAPAELPGRARSR